MTRNIKLLGAVAVAGLAAAAGSALTGTGLATGGTAASPQFVGGTITQSVTGATLTSIVYGYADPTTKTAVNSITLTFASTADAVHVAAVPSGGSGGTFSCSDVSSNSSSCTFAATTTELGYTGLTSLAVTTS